MSVEVGTVYATVLPDMTKFGTALNASASSAATQFGSSFSSSLTRAGRGFSSVGKSLTRFVTLPLLGIGAVSTKLALDFNTQFSRMSVLAGNLGVSLGEAKKGVEALAIKTGQDPTELANALYFTASAGLKASEVMPVLAQSAKAAAIGMGDAQTTAQTLTSVLNAYADTGIHAANVTNILTEAVKVGKAEPADLAANIGQVIPVASQLGVTFDQVAASIAAATNIGVDTARASTGLRFLLASFQKPTAAAITVFKNFGFTVGQVQHDLADPSVGLLGTLKELADKFDLSTVAGKAAFATVVGGARGAVIANALIGKNFGAVSDAFDQVAKSAEDGATVFNDAFKKMNATPAQQLARALSELKVAGIKLGNELIPIITHDIIPAVQSVVRAFSSLSPETKKLVIELGGLAIIAGPILRVAGALLRVGGALTSVGTAGSGAATGLSAFARALPAVGVVIQLGRALQLTASSAQALFGQFFDASRSDADWRKALENAAEGFRLLGLHIPDIFPDPADLKGTRQGLGEIRKALQAGNITVEEATGLVQELADKFKVDLPQGARAVAESLAKSSHGFSEFGKATFGQKQAIDGTKRALELYGVTLSKHKQWVLDALISTHQYDAAITLLQNQLEKATKGVTGLGGATKQQATDGAEAARANRSNAAAMAASADKATTAAGFTRDFNTALKELPKSVVTLIKANTAGAIAQLNTVKDLISALPATKVINIKLNQPGSGQVLGVGPEHGAFFPGAMRGGFVMSEQVVRIGEHNKPEMVLPLQDKSGIDALTKALVKAGAGGGGSGRMHIIEGRIDPISGAVRILAREEEDDQQSFHRTLQRMGA